MKRILRITTGLAVLVMASSVQASLIIISDLKPSEYVVAQTDPDGTQDAGLDTETQTNAGGTRAYAVGQSFKVDAGGVVVAAISLQQGSLAYAGGNAEMKIALFDMETYAADSFGTFTDPFAGEQTTVPIYVETFGASAAVSVDKWVTFDLTTNQTLAAGSYGFLVWVEDAALVGGEWRFRGNWTATDYYADGQRLRVTSAGNLAATGDMNFVIQTIPEPATLSLLAACGAAVLLIRRRFII